MYALKIRAMKFYADKTEIEVLQELSKYSTDDIKEMMSDEKCSTWNIMKKKFKKIVDWQELFSSFGIENKIRKLPDETECQHTDSSQRRPRTEAINGLVESKKD
jgi:hypothetical protein